MMAILGMIFKPIVLLFKLLFFIAKKTGIWLFLTLFPVLSIGLTYLGSAVLNENTVPQSSSPLGWVESISPGSVETNAGLAYVFDWSMFLALIPTTILVGMTIARSIIRVKNDDPGWTYRKAVRKQNKQQPKQVAQGKVANNLYHSTPTGLTFGKVKHSYVCREENADGHVLVIGGAGSGKSSTVAIPTLMSWKATVFAIDIKGELFERTHKARGKAKVFNPLDKNTAGYDPFAVLAVKSTSFVADVKDIALAIIPLPKDVKDPFWIEGAQNIFTAGLMFSFLEGRSFIEAVEWIQSRPVKEMTETIMSSGHDLPKMFIVQYIGMDEKTLAGIMGELSNKIIPLATDADIRRVLSKKEGITPADLERGCDIFIQLPEYKLEQWKTLLTLIVNQFLKSFERREERDCEPILFMLDEFPRLGKIQAVLDGLATLRSKKVTIALFVQSLAQIDLIYSTDARKVIADNCVYKAVLQASDADTQDYLSKLVGTYDKELTSRGQQYEQYTGMGKGKSTTRSVEEKRIIKPEEFATLTETVLFTPFGFARIARTPYYTDPYFKRLV